MCVYSMKCAVKKFAINTHHPLLSLLITFIFLSFSYFRVMIYSMLLYVIKVGQWHAGICCFWYKHATRKTKNKDCLVRNLEIVSFWSEIYMCWKLCQRVRTIPTQLSVLFWCKEQTPSSSIVNTLTQ